jgi:hypothetical protein
VLAEIESVKPQSIVRINVPDDSSRGPEGVSLRIVAVKDRQWLDPPSNMITNGVNPVEMDAVICCPLIDL